MEFIEALFQGTREFIEVRELPSKKQHFFSMEDIKAYDPPKDSNIYYGVFSRASRSGTARACNTSSVVWCDYDSFAGGGSLSVEARIKEVRQRIKEAGLPEASILVNSGNGIHSYWLLSERASNGIVQVNRAIALITKGDIKATDKARILRLPNTNNVKDINKPLRCEVVQANYSLKYDLSLFKELLGVSIGVSIGESITKPLEAKLGASTSLIDNVDRPCIASMLKGVTEGERNFALGRITKWLQLKGYTQVNARNIILKWNKLNVPEEEQNKLLSDFYSYWNGEYKLLGCTIDKPELQSILNKYCNRPECSFSMAIGNIKLENSITYNNRLLNDLYNITGNDLIIYGLLVRHKEGLTTSLLIEKLTSRATGKPCMSKPTRIKSIDTLKKKGFIEIKEGVQSKGWENIYKAIPQGTYGLGYTLLSNGAIQGAITKEVTAGELKLYVLLMKYAFGKGSCYPSLDTMAKQLRTSPSNISKYLKELEKVDYIKRYKKVFNGVEKLDIRLLM